METVINGSDLMVFVGGKSIALATSHSLSISGDTTDISNKDLGGGTWSAGKVSKLSWTAQSSNLYSITGFNTLFNLMAAKTEVTLVFALKKETALPSDGHWTPATTGTYTGTAVITGLEVNAQDGDNATFSVTFTGTGALEADVTDAVISPAVPASE